MAKAKPRATSIKTNTKKKPFEVKLSQELNLKESFLSFNDHLNDSKEYVLGIDEAGRGPILGYMVYAGLLLKETDRTAYKDSKQLSETQRENIYKTIQKDKIHFVFKISATVISETMLSSKNEDLDDLARFAIMEIVKYATTNFRIKHIYIDKIGKRGFDKYLFNRFSVPITLEPKADAKYQCVSGASIVAKVTRDSFLSKCMGSGYPSDPNTKKYLVKTFDPIYGWGDNVRYSWSTAERFFEKKNKKVLNKLYSFNTVFL
ncbi:Ribonuclease H2 subunit A [Cucumispora dikerogammari]|nr:Ribonuclease H2 subunit A [Cucumispora dikerogammari]